MGRFMALDIGDARIGVALSDPLGIIAQPSLAVENRGRAAYREIAKIVKEKDVHIIVVGLPLELSGEEGPQVEKIRRFVLGLSTYFQSDTALQRVVFEEIDERFSTVTAEQIISGTDKKNAARRALRDSVAAAIILESYLSLHRKSTTDVS